jgi:hypothetical protein
MNTAGRRPTLPAARRSHDEDEAPETGRRGAGRRGAGGRSGRRRLLLALLVALFVALPPLLALCADGLLGGAAAEREGPCATLAPCLVTTGLPSGP